mgnify:CR=1 FL=1
MDVTGILQGCYLDIIGMLHGCYMDQPKNTVAGLHTDCYRITRKYISDLKYSFYLFYFKWYVVNYIDSLPISTRYIFSRDSITIHAQTGDIVYQDVT